MKSKLVLRAICLIVASFACVPVVFSTAQAKDATCLESHDLPVSGAINRLALSAGVPVDVVVAGGSPKITLCGPRWITDHLEVTLKSGLLNISGIGSYQTPQDTRLVIVTSRIDSVVDMDGSPVFVKNISGALKLSAQGSGEITLVGSTERLDIDLTGSSKIDLREVKVRRLNVDLLGSGEILLGSVEDLKSHVTGSGRIVR